jgi:hypothetical protein
MMGLRSLRGFVAVVAIGLMGLACDPAEVVDTPSPSVSASVDPSAAAEALLLAPWRPAPLIVPGNLVESARYVCANQEDPATNAAIENLPVAVADARGGAFLSLILADDQVAFECRLKLEMVGEALGTTIIEPPSRLAPSSKESLGDDGISVVSHNRVEEDGGPRTIAIGRIGEKAFEAAVGFNDEKWFTASKGGGWWYIWWPGVRSVGAIVSANSRSEVIQGVSSPDTEIEGRVIAADWWVDPAGLPLSTKTTTVPTLIHERPCASGRSPEGRVLEPAIFSSQDAVLITMWVRRPTGAGQDCQGNPDFPVEIKLPEPLGGRKLLDGSSIPPRDATEPP